MVIYLNNRTKTRVSIFVRLLYIIVVFIFSWQVVDIKLNFVL